MKIRIIIADDERPAREFLKRLLAEIPEAEILGEAENGADAVRLINDLRPHLALLDMQMPEMNGYEATRMLREQGCVIPIVALTASVLKSDENKCLQAGCDGYLTKPIQRTELVKVLQKYLLFEGIPAAVPSGSACPPDASEDRAES